MALPPIDILDADDPRVADYRLLKERRLNEEGLTFLVVEHDMPLVMRLCDPVIVLDRGQKIAEGPAAKMQNDPRVLAAYLGA